MVRVACGVLALLALAPAVARADYEYAGQWPVPSSATGLAVGSGGVYVTRSSGAFGEQSVRRYSLAGKLLATWGDPATLTNPSGVATAPDGRVLVSDRFGKVLTYGADGTFAGQRALTGPCGDELLIKDLDVDRAGDVFVAFYDNCNLVQGETRYGVIRADGAFNVTGVWGQTGAQDGQFNQPVGVASDGHGAVYVADSSNYRVQRFAPTGVFAGKWGQLGGGRGEFNGLEDVAVSPSGEVFAADRNNERIQRFSPEGRLLEELRIPGGVRYRGLVTRLDFDAQGRLYALSTGHGTEDEVSVFVPGSAVTVAKQTLRRRGGRVAVKVACGAVERCTGRLTVRAGKRVLGSRSYRVAAGKRGVVRVAVRGRLARRVTVVVTPKGGKPSRRALTLRY